jgi:hypothetical protein
MFEIIKDISGLLSCLTVIITFLGLVLKPTRKRIETWIRKVMKSDELVSTMDAHTNQLDQLSKKLDVQEKKLDIQEKKSDAADKQILSHMQGIDTRLDKLDQRVLENERDRIKSELSEYASRCARGMKIYPEEMVHIEEMYAKYSNQLHCNHTGTQNYNIIANYYKNQDWLKA